MPGWLSSVQTGDISDHCTAPIILYSSHQHPRTLSQPLLIKHSQSHQHSLLELIQIHDDDHDNDDDDDEMMKAWK